MGKNRKLRKAEFIQKTGLVGELKFTPNQMLQIHKIVDFFITNKASLMHHQKQYRNIDGEYVALSDSDIGELYDALDRLKDHLLKQEARIRQGLKPLVQELPASTEAPTLPTVAKQPEVPAECHDLAAEWCGGA